MTDQRIVSNFIVLRRLIRVLALAVFKFGFHEIFLLRKVSGAISHFFWEFCLALKASNNYSNSKKFVKLHIV